MNVYLKKYLRNVGKIQVAGTPQTLRVLIHLFGPDAKVSTIANHMVKRYV